MFGSLVLIVLPRIYKVLVGRVTLVSFPPAQRCSEPPHAGAGVGSGAGPHLVIFSLKPLSYPALVGAANMLNLKFF